MEINPFPRPGLAGWTVDQLEALGDVLPYPIELISGQIVVMPPASIWHNNVKSALASELRKCETEGLRVLFRQGVIVDERTDLVADVLAIDAAAVDENAHSFEAEVVFLVVEIVGNARNNRTDRPAIYARAKIPYFWLVEKEDREPAIYVQHLTSTGYKTVAVFRHGDTVKVSEPFEAEFPVAALTAWR